MGLKDDDDDDAEGEEADGEAEKADPANVNPERLKAFNVRTLTLYLINYCASTVTRVMAMFNFHGK